MDLCKGDDAKMARRQIIRDVFFNIIDDKAMLLLCKRISSSSGDIRVVFDVIKTAF